MDIAFPLMIAAAAADFCDGLSARLLGAYSDIGKELDIDPVSAALNGGDDFRLLFTIPIGSHDKFRHDFQTFDIIGHLAKPDVGAVLVTPDGVELPMRAQGWE